MTHAFDIKGGRHLFFRRKTILVYILFAVSIIVCACVRVCVCCLGVLFIFVRKRNLIAFHNVLF